MKHSLPGDIERTSLAIIARELAARGIEIPPEHQAVVHRVIHATADFDYAASLRFTPGAAARGAGPRAARRAPLPPPQKGRARGGKPPPGPGAGGAAALAAGGTIVTDTNMALAGVSKPALARLGGAAFCYMADPAVAAAAKAAGTTRAVAAMGHAAAAHPGAVFAVGNAPTALFALCDAMERGDFRPALVIGVPVGFVNVVESKERLMEVCQRLGVPAIAAMGRKGGSSVAAAICNALLYTAAGQLDPAARGW